MAAIEAKLFSDLGPSQLDRYLSAFTGLGAYAVLHLGRLPVDLHRHRRWMSLTWETVLGAYTASTNTWVATTAEAWIAQLDAVVPAVGEQTVWNDVPDDAAGMELALRARIAWLANRAESWCDLEQDMAPSSGGGNWAVQFSAPTATPDLTVTAELQEGMTAYEWRRDPNRPYRDGLRGPVVLVCLRQDTEPATPRHTHGCHSLTPPAGSRSPRWRTAARQSPPMESATTSTSAEFPAVLALLSGGAPWAL